MYTISFIDFMVKGESLLDYINLLSPNESEKNDLFKSFVLSVISIENFKISYILDNT